MLLLTQGLLSVGLLKASESYKEHDYLFNFV